MAKNHYGEVTNRILAQFEAGAPPWIKEWKSIGRGNIPKNAVTKRPYSGGNVIFLWAHGYATQRWLTFKQALDVGGVVRKGEHGVKVYFVSKVEKMTDTDEVRHVPFLNEYTVFNVAQCHGLPGECLTGEVTALNLDERNADVQDFFLCAEFGINKEVRHASYIANSIELLRADDRAFFTAASQAQKAADYLRGLALTESLLETVA
jgi:antirestriction protein ArdC